MSAELKEKRRGRPRIDIDWKAFDALCKLQCTRDEIAGFFEVSPDTISRAVKRTYGVDFAAYRDLKGAAGRVSLRRAQYQLALAGNATMLIWLGKQWLAQRDRTELTGAGGGPIAASVVTPALTEAEAHELYRQHLVRP